MKLKVKFIFAILMALLYVSGAWAQKSVVWEKPLTAYSRVTDMIEVSKVEFNKKETLLTIHIFPFGAKEIGFSSGTVLQADGKDYKVKAIKNHALDAGIKMPESGDITIEMTFEPVPKDVQSVTFNMPGAFSIENIHPRNYKRDGLTNTYWRKDKTGEWLIGFTKDKVIYDCRVWNITARNKDDKSGDAIVAKDGEEQLLVNVQNEKKGKRRILIAMTVADCSLITDETLPDYPTKATSTVIADNDFRSGDSITIVGWYKDMPAELLNKSHEFEASYNSIFNDERVTFSAPIDDEGHFTLRMPVENTEFLYCDWERCNIMFLAEPGETYFLLKDFNDGQTLVMGKNARLQNELLANREMMRYRSGNYQHLQENGGAMGYLAHNDSLMNVAMDKLEKHLQEHPTLSERYRKFMRNYILADFGRDLMQGRFRVKSFRLPDEYINNVTENIWNKMERPYTMVGNGYPTFFRDYTDHMADVLREKGDLPVKLALLEANRRGEIALSDDDKKLLSDYNDYYKAFDKKVRETPDSLQMPMINDFNNSEMVQRINALLARDGMQKAMEKTADNIEDVEFLKAIDKLGWDRQLGDFYIAQRMYKRIDGTREPLSAYMLNFAKENIKIPAAVRMITDLNNKYIAINNRTLSTDYIKSSDDVAGLSEGEQILRKLIEPYKGKIVLLDVWGTWCGPCKERLSHSQEEYERLKDYDIVYLYLANRSPEESWKNVIKEYNVTGDNVVHYNLPEAQQKAVENHLSVHSFPSYFLFDQQGNLLEGVNADPLDLDGLERLINRLTNK